MRILFKIIIVLLVLCIICVLGIFAVKKFSPEHYTGLEHKAKSLLVQKITVVLDSLKTKSLPESKKQVVVEPKIPALEEVVDHMTNEAVYKAICDDEKYGHPKNKFLGCQRCPNYLNKHNPDYFSMSSYAQGAVIQKDEAEAIFFMHGCLEDANSIAIVLRKSFGGWRLVSQFKNVSFDEPPLVFKDAQGFLIFVGKRKLNNELINKETLFSLTFKNNKLHSQDIFSTQIAGGFKCSYQFFADMDSPKLDSEHRFSIKLDVMGWQDIINSDCKIPTRNVNVHLKPDLYTLNFTQKNDSFIADKLTRKIITELEKAQE